MANVKEIVCINGGEWFSGPIHYRNVMATFDLEIHQSPSKLKGGNVETGVH
jgi:hypothetical protein